MTDEFKITDADREAAGKIAVCSQCGGTGFYVPGYTEDGPADPAACPCGGSMTDPALIIEDAALSIARAMAPERERAARMERLIRNILAADCDAGENEMCKDCPFGERCDRICDARDALFAEDTHA